MKLVIYASILFSMLCMGCQQSSSVAGAESKNLNREGHEQGNGVDNLPYWHMDAWFSGDVTVNYCVEIANDFGLPENTVLDNVQSAFKKWKDYIEDNKINEQMLRDALSSLKPNEQDKAKDLVAFTKTNRLKRCDGHEDIKFYFGIEDKVVTEAKKAHVNPTAFAQNIYRNEYSGKGKGFVWVAKQDSLRESWMGTQPYPDWHLQNALLGILTHEIGHIYGIGHIEGTIMDPGLGIFLQKDTLGILPESFRQRALKEIDFKKQLFTPSILSDLRSYEGQMTLTAMYFCRPLSCPLNSYDPVKVDQEITENFQQIVGRVPVGVVTSSYFQGKLKLMDAISVSEFNLAIDFDQTPSVGSKQSIFKFSRFWPETREGNMVGSGGSAEHKEVSYLGSLTKQDGTEVNIMIEQNNYGPFSIFYINKGKKKALLIMDALKL